MVGKLVKATGYSVVINPHPRLSPEERGYLMRPEVVCTDLPLTKLLPNCHFYVASASATIRWAIACAKPVLNYDIYGYHYDDFSDVAGVVTVDSEKAFEQMLVRMREDSVFFSNLQTLQQAVSMEWGCLDGKSAERLISLFKSRFSNNDPAL